MENKINYYTYESFIYKIFSSRIYQNVIYKYDEKFDFFHKQKLNDKRQISFYHLISFLYNSVLNIFKIIDKENFRCDFVECEFCIIGCEDCNSCAELVDRMANFFLLSKKHLCIMFNVIFEIDLSHVQHIFSQVKVNIYPFVGTSGFDLNFFLYENIKSLKRHDVEYKGILYCHEKYKKLSPTYISLVHNILNDFYVSNKTIFIIAFATGPSVLHPEHWCMLFVDFGLKTLFFYNSLADHSQICVKFFQIFNSHCQEKKLNFKFVFNQARQQNKNKLCGLFATDFAMSMLNCDEHKREALFQTKFNVAGDFDKYLEAKQNLYIGVKDYPIKTTALNRFIQFKKITCKMFTELFKK